MTTNNNDAAALPEVDAIPESDIAQERSTSIVAEVHDVVALPMSPSAVSTAASFQTISLGESMDTIDAKPRAIPTPSPTKRHKKKRRPAITSISVFKVARDEKLGVSFKSVNGRLQISKLLDEGNNLLGSKFGKNGDSSDHDDDIILPGDNVLCINHVYCALWSPTKAIQALKDLVGLITIQLSPPDNGEDGGGGAAEVDDSLAQAVVCKSNPNDKLGIAFDKQNGRLRISALHPNGLLGGNNSALTVGDYLIEINDVPCAELSASVAKEIITNTSMMIKLLAVSTDTIGGGIAVTEISSRNILLGLSSGRFAANTQLEQQLPVIADPIMDTSANNDGSNNTIVPAYISAMVVKPTKTTSLGIQLTKRTGGFIVIKNILDGSIISKTPLQIGMILLSINNMPCQYLTKEEAIANLRNQIGQIHFVAQNTTNESNPNYVEAMVTKIHGPTTKVGVGFKNSPLRGGRVEISSINPNRLFANSVLNVRDIIISINNNPNAKRMTSFEIVNYIGNECPEYVTILAKTSHSTGVVVFSS